MSVVKHSLEGLVDSYPRDPDMTKAWELKAYALRGLGGGDQTQNRDLNFWESYHLEKNWEGGLVYKNLRREGGLLEILRHVYVGGYCVNNELHLSIFCYRYIY